MIVKNSSLSVDTEKLRKKILDLAMRGKLVPQDSQDEPASVLLEKKLKSSSEKPHDIPMSWKWIVLGSGVKFYNGRAYKKNELLNDDKLTPVLRVGNLFTNSSWYYSNLKLDLNKYIDNGDLIYAWSASFGPKIWNGGRVIYHYHIWKLEYDQDLIDKKFLYYFLLDERNVVGKTDLHGSTMKHITKTNMEHLPFPLPPLAEQKRIVAKVEECMQAIKTIEDSSKEYEKLQNQLDKKVLDLAMHGKLVPQDSQDEPASVLLEKIKEEKAQLIKEKKIKKSKPLPEITDEEKPFEIPESWEWVRLGEIFDITSSKRVKKNEWKERGIPFYRAREIVSISKNEKLKDPIFIDEETYKEKISVSGKPREKDILITCVGTLGIPYIVKPNDKFYFKDGNIIWLKNYFKIIPEYIKYLLFCSYMKKEINNGRGTTVATLTIVRANNLLIPLPPLAEQKRIVAKIEEIKQYLEI